ncbi:MAG: putative acyl-CoA dehydrogenase AidB [Pseudomonadales bacterium]|nr:putative acyl-CoA dehydrogenase AidB [Pseudomonadales bacterium]
MDIANDGAARVRADTHEVLNQPTPLEPYDAWATDTALGTGVEREGGGWAGAELAAYGRAAGGPLFAAGFLAENHRPELQTHDRYGHRVDRVEYHPAYHELMRSAIEAGIPSLPWTVARPGAHVARAALEYLHDQADAGTGCPLTMTFAAVPALRVQPDVSADWLRRAGARVYDPADRPWFDKAGVTIGMAMTEKQGGSDLRGNTTRARAVAGRGPGARYELTGHKWFCSAPMCDGFLMLAQAAGGLSCFLLPRWRGDGRRNGLRLQRLKNKLGNRSNASAEIELHDAEAWMIGPEGRGVRTIIEMVMMTRFDCIVGSAALMRQAVAQALHHCSQRKVSGRTLGTHPLMQNVLADLALESEAALRLALRVARRLDEAPADARARDFVRVATAVGKFWVCKRAPALAAEAAECLGGGGYVEESILPRLYREAPVNSIWEGSGNVQCTDVLRALQREPQVAQAFLAEIDTAAGAEPRIAASVAALRGELAGPGSDGYRARALVTRMAVTLQAALLLESGDTALAEPFIATRLAGRHMVYGELPAGVDCEALIARALPRPA